MLRKKYLKEIDLERQVRRDIQKSGMESPGSIKKFLPSNSKMTYKSPDAPASVVTKFSLDHK